MVPAALTSTSSPRPSGGRLHLLERVVDGGLLGDVQDHQAGVGMLGGKCLQRAGML
jgi:hypothetical protein